MEGFVLRERSDAEHPCPECGCPTEKSVHYSDEDIVQWECIKCGHVNGQCQHTRKKLTGYGEDSWEENCEDCGLLLSED